MTARKKKRLEKLKRQEFATYKKSLYPLVAIVLLVLFIFSVIFFTVTKAFSGQENYVVAKLTDNSDAKITVYSFLDNNISTILVPKDTLVNVAMNRGDLRLSSVEKIIKTEGLGTEILSNSLMKTFNIPIDSLDSKVSFHKRINLFLFSLSASKQNIDLNDTSQITKTELEDGEEGYVFKGSFSPFIAQLFNSRNLSSIRLEIVRRVDFNYQSSQDLSEILTNMGVHVFTIKKQAASDEDCIIETKNIEKMDRISSIFKCELRSLEEGNTDARIILGNTFARRF